MKKLVLVSFLVILMIHNYNLHPLNKNNSSISQDPNPDLQSFQSQPVKNNPSFQVDDEVLFNVSASGVYYNGYNLFVLRRESRLDTSFNFNTLYITDMEGNVIRTRNIGSFHSLDYLNAEFVDSNTILYGNGNLGPVLWDIETNNTYFVGGKGHHDYEYNHNTHTIFTLNFYEIEINDEKYIYDKIEEYTLDGEKIWEFDTRPLVPETIEVYGDLYAPHGQKDVTHANSVFYDNQKDVIYLNSRNANTFWKINHSSGEVIWGLGELGDFVLKDGYGNIQSSLFYNAHSVEKIAENRFIIFDNDRHNRTDLSSKNSRMLEIEIDVQTMEAEVVWQWTAPSSYYSSIWGDADLLPNGNRFGTFGTVTHPKTSIGARLVEVDEGGNIVWEMNFPITKDYKYGIYRAERFRFTPGVQSLDDKTLLPQSEITISWQVWYNFRNKYETSGQYEVYLNNTSILTQSVEFGLFGRQKRLPIILKDLELGTHNLTLILTDEEGHRTTDSITLFIVPFYLSRTGPSKVEQGFEKNQLVWDGNTSLTLDYHIKVANQSVVEGLWTGGKIVFNLNQFVPGSYQGSLKLINNTIVVFEDDFSIEIQSQQIPSVTSPDTRLTLQWNETYTLQWEISDFLPASWSIYRNDSLIKRADWNETTKVIFYQISGLAEGLYEFTLSIMDQNGLDNQHTIWITIIPPEKPVILPISVSQQIEWGSDTTMLWEIHGVSFYSIIRNGTRIIREEFGGNRIQYQFDYQADKWRLGMYHLQILVSNGMQNASLETWIELYLSKGDPYANTVVGGESINYVSGKNALGKPDGGSAVISTGYTNGYMTMDMGEDEEIINGQGDDFKIVVSGGNYQVKAVKELFGEVVKLGTYFGNTSIDIDGMVEEIRYLRIEYLSGEDVKLDGIIAHHHRIRNYEMEIPAIEELEERYYWSNATYFAFDWSAESLTPWNYSILINGKRVDNGPWYGKPVGVNQTIVRSGTYNVTLVVFNLFEKQTSASMTVHVVSVFLDYKVTLKYLAFLAAVFVGLVWLPIKLNRRF